MSYNLMFTPYTPLEVIACYYELQEDGYLNFDSNFSSIRLTVSPSTAFQCAMDTAWDLRKLLIARVLIEDLDQRGHSRQAQIVDKALHQQLMATQYYFRREVLKRDVSREAKPVEDPRLQKRALRELLALEKLERLANISGNACGSTHGANGGAGAPAHITNGSEADASGVSHSS